MFTVSDLIVREEVGHQPIGLDGTVEQMIERYTLVVALIARKEIRR